MLDFILERYNYWIFIVLMMVGLYIVISRGNLVKKIIGLNVFQTSVFIFYISIGKIRGGTAPIFVGGHGDSHGDDHGGGHGADQSGDHGAEHGSGDASHGDASHAAEAADGLHHAPEADANAVDVAAKAVHADAGKIANDVHVGAANKIFSGASGGDAQGAAT
ncbi:MAG: cation:proton antiporter subunit C, partial [Pseudomonadota bacterium]